MVSAKTNYKSTNWDLKGFRQPILTIKSNSFFRESIVFRIVNIEIFDEILLELDNDRNNDIGSIGDGFIGYFEFPRVGNINTSFEFIGEKDRVSNSYKIRVEEDRSFKSFKFLLAQYLFLSTPDADLETLRKTGLELKSIRDLISYGYAKNKEDLLEVSKLRSRTYGATTKVNSDTKFVDDYDPKSKVIMVRHHNCLIASVRIFYPRTESDKLEHQHYEILFPKTFPSNTEIAEMMRLCTHERYRRSDLLLGILEFAAVDILKQNRNYVLGCAEKKLVPLYLKLGFRDIKIRYLNNLLNNVEHHILLMDISAIGKGKMNPISWNMIWGKTAQFAQKNGTLKLKGFSKLRVQFYHAINPITGWIYHKVLNKKY